jgi:hypothetical protein
MGKVGFLAFPSLEEALPKPPIRGNNSLRDTNPLNSYCPERQLGVRLMPLAVATEMQCNGLGTWQAPRNDKTTTRSPQRRENGMKTKPVMNRLAVILCCIFLLTPPLFARESTDVIVMKNGDHLTGEIKGLNAGVLYVSMKYILGTSSLQWSEVARLESKQLFLVKTEGGSVYTGTLNTASSPSDRPVKIEVRESSGQKVEIDRPRIVAMGVTSTKFFQRFNGSIDSGIIYSKGNESTQYSLGSQVNYPRERWAAAASFNSTLSDSTGAPVSTRNQVDLDAFRLLRSNNWFYEGLGIFLHSSEQGISRQVTAGGAVGRYLKNTNHARISVFAGFAGQNTEYQDDIFRQNAASGLIAANVQFFRFNKTNANVTTVLLPAISQPGRVKFNMNATYYIKLIRNLSWNVSFYGNWDSQPPDGLSGSDYGSNSGLSWTFGNK